MEGLLDENGNRVISYYYTAYGKGYYISGESDMTATLATVNPLGYRGYVMDLGTFLCYCQSRYYDPTVGRFINADVYISTGQGFVGNNMFAYCLNNPVIYSDFTGRDAILVVIYIKTEGGLPVVGHAFLYIQDSEGNWYVTEYTGSRKENAQIYLGDKGTVLLSRSP